MTVVEMSVQGSTNKIIGIDVIDCIMQVIEDGGGRSDILTVSFCKRELTKDEWYEIVRRSEGSSLQQGALSKPGF